MAGLIKWDPFKDIEKFFSEDFAPAFVPTFRLNDLPVDIYEDDNNIVVEVGLTGVDPKNVSLKVEENRLKISGRFDEKKETKAENYWRKEIKRGEFNRTIVLPQEVNAAEAKAKYENGILKINLPKAAKVDQSREIKIES